MESPATERVNEKISRRKRRKGTVKNRTPTAESPPSLLRSRVLSNKREREEDNPSDTFYTIRGILKEKWEAGRLLYLIDWEDNPETGEVYDQSWEPRENLTRGAIIEWEGKKPRETPGQSSSQIQSTALVSNPESQPIRSANRQRISRRANLSSPTSKKPRRAGTAETARFQSVSQEDSLELAPLEIKDSYEEQLSNERSCVRVVVQVDEDFDHNAYVHHFIESSQPSQLSQPSQAKEVYQDSPASRSEQFWQHSQNSVYAAPRVRTPRLRRKLSSIWDEDLPAVIPDSQDLPGSSSFKASEIASSKTRTTSRSDTGQSAEGAVGTPFKETQFRSSYIPTDSTSRVDYRRSEPPSHQSRRNLLTNEIEVFANLREFSTRPSSSGGRPTSSFGETSLLEPLALSDQFFPIERTARSEACATSRIPASAPAQPPLDLLSEEAGPIFSEGQPLQGINLEAFPKDIPGIDNSNELINPGGKNQSLPSRDPESQILIVEPPVRPAIDGSTSSSEATWQAAQVVSFDLELSPLRDSAATFRSLSKTPLHHGTPPSPSNSASSHLNSNTVNSHQPRYTQPHSQSVSEFASSQKQISHQGLEDVLESIEPREDTISIPPRPSPLSSLLSGHPSTYESYHPEHTFASAKTVDMPDRNEGTLGVAEMLRRARAAAVANTTARQDTERQRLASVTQATPAPGTSQVLPLRDPSADIPDIIAHGGSPSSKSSPEVESKIQGLHIIPLGPSEYAVPLPMVSVARSMYIAEINNHKKDIKALIENVIDSNGMGRIHSVISNIMLLCDHQDLVTDDSATQENYTDLIIANYAENVSTKCQLIAGLLKGLRSSDEHIVILVRPGRMARILEAMCRYYEIDPSQQQRSTLPSQLRKWPLQVTIIPTSLDENSIAPQLASIVVAFDSTFKPGQYSSLRVQSLHPSRVVPLVRLIVTHSIEHLALCIDEQVDFLERTRAMVDSAYQTREEMGKLDGEEYLDPEVAGKAISEHILTKDPSGIWPLLPMPEIEGLDLTIETLSDSQTRIAHPSGSTTQSHNTSSPAPSLQSGLKRSLGAEAVVESPKRQRLTPISSEQDSSLDNEELRASETVLAPSNSNPVSKPRTDSLMVTPSKVDKEESIPALLKKVARLEEQMQVKSIVEAELRHFNQQLESRCKDYENTIHRIQPKYQEALNDQGRFQHELTEVVRRESSLRQKYDAGINSIAKIREEKAAADAELTAARATLSTSSIPEISEFGKLKTDLRTAQENCEKLQKRITNMQSEVDYMRGQYQTASTAAADSAVEMSELREENAVLKRKASDNARQIHEIQASSEIKQHLERIEELENEKVDLEMELSKKTEELKSLLNGRRATRGTSVPRSPRMGTMSPNVRERPMARVLGSGVGSRGNSPAPGEAAPIRGTFGDALFADKGVGRWANHLT